MTLSVSTGRAVDLRVHPVDEVLDHVERSLQVHLLPDTVIRKRRFVGARTDRDTWVRIERRLLNKITDQGWNGGECAARLEGIAQPEWRGCVIWREMNKPDSMCFRQSRREIFVVNGARAWRPLERDLTVSAKYVGSHVQLTGGCTIHSPATGGPSKSGLITLPERTQPRLGAARLPGGGSAGMIRGD